MDIPLPEGVSVISGSSTAKVTVSMSGLTTRMVTTSDIELINTPSGTNVSLITQSLDVASVAQLPQWIWCRTGTYM